MLDSLHDDLGGVTGIVLAGGASRRMGRDKAWVELGGKILIARVIDVLRLICDEIIVVANEPWRFEPLGVRVMPDEFPNTGSLGGLFSGLKAAQTELAIGVACDMPFLNPALLRFLISRSSGHDIVIPSVRDESEPVLGGRAARKDTAKQKSLHPLHAVYRKTCLTPMRDAIARGDLRMISFHESLRVRIVQQTEVVLLDPQFLSFWNVNTPDELARAERCLGQAV